MVAKKMTAGDKPAKDPTIKWCRTDENHNLDLPKQQTEWSAGYDLQNITNVTFTPSVVRAVHTGWCVSIPHGYVGLVRMRSGIARKYKLTMANSGVIDSDYRGEIIVDVAQHRHGISTRFEEGTRLFQMIVVPCVHWKSEEVPFLDETERGESGFGSTGQ